MAWIINLVLVGNSFVKRKFVFLNLILVLSNISKTSASVSSGFQALETFETTRVTRPQAEWFFSSVWKPDETRSTSF